ncbi:MAG TPA: cobyric acid synthase [Thermoleophilia bacterium]|nr:cobyric acid synthase [Thermoleophilia bacterium]
MTARTLMLQGTASHAGKTVLAAALCRSYARRGLRVAPFKAQNIALNSFVTADSGEMGRAQVYQARAAGLEPHVDMNPVLLKPSSDATSQVVVMGRPVRHMSVSEYEAYQPEVWPVVTAAFERLRSDCDLVILEGAGSSAEVNLRGRDIVNMRMALHACSPVLLVGDIDLGGVFASLLGHVELFTAEERALVAGFVINKFRGEASQLDSGIEVLLERTGVPTLGVVPWLEAWSGEEEDSVALGAGGRRLRPDAPLQIAVIRLPFISNFTDVDALLREPDVGVRYATAPPDLEGAAAIVLPGSKSTIADLDWLVRTGLAAAVRAAAAAGTPVVGVCGGYQMLGRRILDPEHVESSRHAVDGLGLLDAETTFTAEKRTVRAEGAVASPGPLGAPGAQVAGYEIHMGRTALGPAAAPLLRLRAGAPAGTGVGGQHLDGAVAGNVCGSYLHGLFDHPELRAAFLGGLRAARGLAPPPPADPSSDDLDRLADHVESHLDMDTLDTLVGIRT